MKRSALLTLVVLLSSTVVAQATTFESLDVDGDGRLSADEAKKNAQVDFYDADANKDGGIDQDEYRVATAPSDE